MLFHLLLRKFIHLIVTKHENNNHRCYPLPSIQHAVGQGRPRIPSMCCSVKGVCRETWCRHHPYWLCLNLVIAQLLDTRTKWKASRRMPITKTISIATVCQVAFQEREMLCPSSATRSCQAQDLLAIPWWLNPQISNGA